MHPSPGHANLNLVAEENPLRPMSADEFRRSAYQHADWIAQYFEHIRERPVSPSTQPGDLIASLPETAPEHGESMEQIFGDFRSKIVPALTLWNHPRFFAWFSVSSTPPSILAEFLAATLNVNAMLWRTSA